MRLTLPGRGVSLSTLFLVLLLSISCHINLAHARPSEIAFFPSSHLRPRSDPPPPSVAGVGARRSVVVRHYTLDLTTDVLFQACEPFGPTPVINGSSPGPTLHARAGEILQVRVWNHLASGNLTMHFHGLSMKLHPIMDGTTMISQWPILPGQFYDYQIPLTAEDKGTYFYHSHVGAQAMSAYGVLIVHDPNSVDLQDPSTATEQTESAAHSVEFIQVEGVQGLQKGDGGANPSASVSPYRWDDERLVALGDWWSYSSPARIETQLSADPFVWPGSATKLLCNGAASPNMPFTSPNPRCNQTRATLIGVDCSSAPPSCTSPSTFPTIKLDYGKRYRLRFVGATSLMYVSVAILKPTQTRYTGNNRADREKMTLIEADGSYLDPLEVDFIELTTGQRYSALYTSKSKAEVQRDGVGGVYWMRVESRWRAGPSMWVKLVYPSAAQDKVAQSVVPPVDTSVKSSDVRLLPAESFGWVTAQLSPLSKAGGPAWWYSAPMPGDDEVSRTVVIDTQQVKFYASGKGVKWEENGELYNESEPYRSRTPSPYLVRTFLGDIAMPTPAQLRSALNNPTSYPTAHGPHPFLPGGKAGDEAEQQAAKRRKWAQGYDSSLNLYVAQSHEVVDIIIVNRPSELNHGVEIHPWHMHSHKHYTRLIHPGTFTFTKLEQLYSHPQSDLRFDVPIQRDTTVVYAAPGAAYLNATVPGDPNTQDGGFAVLRYKVDPQNAGLFLLHCHMQFHLLMGMATVWALAPQQLLNSSGPYWPSLNDSSHDRNAQGVKNPAKTQAESNIQGLAWDYLKLGQSVPAVVG